MAESVVEEIARKRLGRTIKGKWRLDRLIGVGGMAAVYAATHRNGARVAIKMLHPTVSASQQLRARFVREGYLANKVDHPGVVRILDDDIDDTDQSAFLVMDLVVGSTLSSRAMERLLNPGEVLDVAEQVLDVLASAHANGIIHRDLKPDNLIVDNKGKVHVLDFGIARLLEGDASLATKTGTAFGTPGFMAPEQAMGRTQQISGRTDLYALGATLFALVSGDFVHAAENPQELLVLVATQPPRSLAEVAPDTAPEVVGLVDKATRTAPEDRWASAEDMLTEVKRLRTALGLGAAKVLPLAPVGIADSTRGSKTGAPPSPPSARKEKTRPPSFSLDSLFAAEDGGRGEPSMSALGTRKSSADTHLLPSPFTPSREGTPSALNPPFERRPRWVPLAVAVGIAALIGIPAVYLATSRGGSEIPVEKVGEREGRTPSPPNANANIEASAGPTAIEGAAASSQRAEGRPVPPGATGSSGSTGGSTSPSAAAAQRPRAQPTAAVKPTGGGAKPAGTKRVDLGY